MMSRDTYTAGKNDEVMPVPFTDSASLAIPHASVF